MAFVHIQISLKGAKIGKEKKRGDAAAAHGTISLLAAATWRDGTSSRFDTTNYF